MSAWPDAHTVFQRNAQYIFQQNANDDWDYGTGVEAGRDMSAVEPAAMTNTLGPATSFSDFTTMGLADQISAESQQSDRISMPSEEKAALLKAKLLAKRSSSNTRAAKSISKPGTPKPITRPQIMRQNSDPTIGGVIQVAAGRARENEQQTQHSNIIGPGIADLKQNMAPNVNPNIAAPTDFKAQEPTDKSVSAAKGQQLSQLQSTVVSPTMSGASNAPTEAVVKVKKAKKDKSPTTEGAVKTRKRKIADDKSEPSKEPNQLLSGTAYQAPKQTIIAATAPAVKYASKLPVDAAKDEDIADWLEFTGYYDLEHRQRLLKLHRRKREIQKELAELDSELNKAANLGPAVPATAAQAHPAGAPQPATSIKRARSPDATSGAAQEQPEKTRRMASAQVSGIDVKTSNVSDTTPRGRARTRSSIDKGRYASRDREGLSRSPVRPSWTSYHQRSGEQREPKQAFSKTWVNPTTNTSRTMSNNYPSYPRINYDNGVAGLELRKGNCRYFMVKSWNWDNVLQAQSDGLWVTQEQNESMYADAFRACRHVIFFFSVNNSKAFQGYARMECLPGNAPAPSWASSLKWPGSKPYKLHWVTIADTKFRNTGNLKNSLNENMPVFVGRDGQEIEDQCAITLAQIIDDDAARQRSEHRY